MNTAHTGLKIRIWILGFTSARSPHWGSDSSTRSEPETQDAEGNSSQEDNVGFLNSCINGRYHCHKRKQITTGEVSCSICNSKLTGSCGHCERCNDFLCIPCMKKYDYETGNVCADSYYREWVVWEGCVNCWVLSAFFLLFPYSLVLPDVPLGH